MSTKILLISILASLLLSGCDYGSRQAFAESIKSARQNHQQTPKK